VANHPSAEKRNRQRITRTLRNRVVTSSVRTFVKRVRTALEAKDSAKAAEALKVAVKALDKAATKGAVHFKAASRTVSRLSTQVARLVLDGGIAPTTVVKAAKVAKPSKTAAKSNKAK
jgi:small subunit ribosomal protein S20